VGVFIIEPLINSAIPLTLSYLKSELKQQRPPFLSKPSISDNNGVPEKVVIDKSAPNNAGIAYINGLLCPRIFLVLHRCAQDKMFE
jgi:hypothetical protein